MAVRPRARNPRGISIAELFIEPPETVTDWISPSTRSAVGHAFALIDRMLRLAEPMFPADPRRRAIEKAVVFVTERLNGEDGLGGIFPAMANALMMFDCLGYAPDHPDRVNRRRRFCGSWSYMPAIAPTSSRAYRRSGHGAGLPRADGCRRRPVDPLHSPRA